MAKYIDQRNDNSGKVIIKIASTLNDQDFANRVIDMFSSRDRSLDGMFKTAEDVILSSLYFDEQCDSLPFEQANRMHEKLATYRTLFGIDEDFSRHEPVMVKKAADQPSVDLFNGKVVHSAEELVKAGAEFNEHKNWMREEDKVVFANNFMKAAEEFGVEDIPASVCVYSLTNVEPRDDISDGIRLHKVAAEYPVGSDDSPYDMLIKIAEATDHDFEGLLKLATILDELDNANSVRESKRGRTIPSGIETVLRKQAEEKDEQQAKNMEKSDIVGQFGDDALDELENSDGTINQARLKQLLELFKSKEEDK